MRNTFLAFFLLLKACASQEPAGWRLVQTGATEQAPDDPDDPAIWIHPHDPVQNLIVGTNKVERPNGALLVFDMQGRTIQRIDGLGRPNNVDIVQGVRLGETSYDLAIVTERQASALRIYTIDADARLLHEAGVPRVFDNEEGDHAAPMGIAMYERPDGAVFVIVGRKSGPTDGYLWQYRLQQNFSLKLVRKFGKFSGRGEIEAIAVDDELGFVYYADEGAGIRKYHADPEHPDAQRELGFFGRSGYRGDREGLAIYATGPGEGFLISTDQIAGGSRYFLYRRNGDQSQPVGVLESEADSTDGIEVGPGILIVMNSGPRNFLIFKLPESLKGILH
jgi:3-phytase